MSAQLEGWYQKASCRLDEVNQHVQESVCCCCRG